MLHLHLWISLPDALFHGMYELCAGELEFAGVSWRKKEEAECRREAFRENELMREFDFAMRREQL